MPRVPAKQLEYFEYALSTVLLPAKSHVDVEDGILPTQHQRGKSNRTSTTGSVRLENKSGGQTEEAEMSDENKLFQSFVRNKTKEVRHRSKYLKEHFEVQEVEKEFVPGEVGDEIRQTEQDNVSQVEVLEEEE